MQLQIDRDAVLAVIPSAKDSRFAEHGLGDWTGRTASQRERDEAMIAFDLWLCGEMGFEREFFFAKDAGRKWPFDYARQDILLAVEREGGTWQKRSRHTSPTGFYRDATKYNSAALFGWTVLRFTVEHILSGEAYNMVRLAVEQRLAALSQAPKRATSPSSRKAPTHAPTPQANQSPAVPAKRPGQRRTAAGGHPASPRPRLRAPVTG